MVSRVDNEVEEWIVNVEGGGGGGDGGVRWGGGIVGMESVTLTTQGGQPGATHTPTTVNCSQRCSCYSYHHYTPALQRVSMIACVLFALYCRVVIYIYGKKIRCENKYNYYLIETTSTLGVLP